MNIRVLVEEGDFDVGAELGRLRTAASGAIVQFVGVMRDHNEGDAVRAMLLEHYPGMTEKSIEAIIHEAASRWPLLATTVIHRVGALQPGDQIVLVAVSSTHRHAAFAACEFIMDFLKTRAPFWKKEELVDGRSRWVDARHSDDAAAERW
ncbi:molybdopterin synthase catalytic subunit MoaE [Spongiibacter sp.]|uniref:molybdopterin synthase catalytic subunit MoaE n=1 Tax=Spongiibacter sp. TaxID=2024860 RepID=UPI00356540D5